MSYIDIAFIAITVFFVLAGACRGLVVSLLSMLRFVIGTPLAFFVGDRYASSIYDSLVREIAYNRVAQEISQSRSLDNIISNVKEITESLPSIFSQGVNLSGNLSIDEISRAITDTVVEPIAVVVIKILLFAVTFVAFYVVTGVLILMIKRLKNKEHMPLKRTDYILGGAFGLIKAMVFLFTTATVIGYICDILPQDNSFLKQAEGSLALEFINTYNPLMK